MTKSQEQLEFAVKLAQIKLSDLRPGDLLNLRDDFLKFFYGEKGQDLGLGSGGVVVQPFSTPLPQDYSQEDFAALQKDASAIFNEIVTGRDDARPSAPRRTIQATLISLSTPIIKGHSILTAQGSTRDMFLLRLFLLLSQQPIDRILRCKAPDCDRIFYRRRKQEFCSTKCTNRDYMKSYRKIPSFAAAAAEENHKRYEKRVKKLRGTKTKVARRPRKKVARHGYW